MEGDGEGERCADGGGVCGGGLLLGVLAGFLMNCLIVIYVVLQSLRGAIPPNTMVAKAELN